MQNLKIIESELAPAYEARQNLKWYSEKIVDMIRQIEDEKFLNQIRTILKRHIEKSRV